MKSLVYSAIKTVTMEDRPEPAPRPDEVVLQVRATGICGSDLAGFLGHSPRRQPGLVLGHEAVGTVARMPAGLPSEGKDWPFAVGQRVVVNPLMPCGDCAACDAGQTNICIGWRILGMDNVAGAFAERVAVPAANVFPIPDTLSDERAVMIEPLANGVHLFNLIGRHQFGTLAIFGAGTQGSLLVSLARMLGYRDIAIVDVNPQRLEVAQGLGAKYLINARDGDPVAAIKAAFGGNGADIVIDAHGSETARQSCVNACRKGGEILLLGLHETFSRVEFNLIVRNELRVQGSFAYTPRDFAQSKKLIENGDIDLAAWTEVLTFEQGQAAFDKLTSDPGATLKIALTP